MDGSRALNMVDGLLPKDKIKIVKTCTVSEAVEVYCELQPDVVLLDITWPYHSSKGFEVARKLLAVKPDVNMMGITTSYVTRVEQLLKTEGVKGYVYYDGNWQTVLQNIVKAIQKVSKGETHFLH